MPESTEITLAKLTLMRRLNLPHQALIEFLAVLCGALLPVGILVFFADRFGSGATWSGLNPGGGGPGFLLLAAPAMVSLFVRSKWFRSLSAGRATALAACGAAACGTIFASTISWLALPELNVEINPLTSGVVGAFFIPRVVVAVLNDAWSLAEVSSPAGPRHS